MHLTRRNFVKLSGAAAGTALVGGMLVGCNSQVTGTGSGTDSGASADSASNKVTLGYWGGTCEAPIFIGYEKGYFAEAGLEPELLLITSDVTALMANDELDCFELTPDKFKPMEQGLELSITDSLHIGCIQGAASAASGIKSITDLEGKRVAADMGSIPQIQIASQMVLAGKDPNKVEWVKYPAPQMETAMNAGEVDAFAQYDPWVDIAVANGATKFYSNTFDEGLKDYLCCFVGMSTRTLNQRPEIGAKLSEAFAKSAKFLQDNPEEATDIIVAGGYVPVNTDSGFTKQLMTDEIKAYTWISGDRELLDESFHEIWMQINRAGAMEDAPKDETELTTYIDETLYNKMVSYQGI